MTAPTVPVTVKLADFGGPAKAGVKITARMDRIDFTADGIFVSTAPVTAVTDALGVAILNVFPNAVAPGGLGTLGAVIRFTASLPGSRGLDVQGVIPNTPCNLVDYVVDQEPNGLGGSERAAAAAQGARDQAVAAAVSTDADVFATGNDRVQTGQDRVQTGLDRIATGQDRTQTGLDRTATGADRAAVGTDRVATEAARDSVNTTGKVFADTATGIAGTASGQTFAVLDAGLQFWNVYKNNAGAAALVASSYTKAYLDKNLPAAFESLDPALKSATVLLDANRKVLATIPDPRVAPLMASSVAQGLFETLDVAIRGATLILDPSRKIVASLAAQSAVLALQSSTAALQAGAVSMVTQGIFETLDPTYKLLVIDPARKVLYGGTPQSAITSVQSEIQTARGNQSSLDARLSHGLTPYGDVRDPYANRWSLREARMRLRKRSLAESTQFVLAITGDSYVQGNFWTQALATLLQNTFGNAGAGWVGFAWWGTNAGPWTAGNQPIGIDGNVRPDVVTIVQVIGTWAKSYNVAANNTPSMGACTSSAAGDYVRFTVPVGHNAAQLFYTGDGTGVVAVSWDDGATYSADIPLNTVGAGNVALPGIPAGATIGRIRVSSGNVSLAGVDLRSAADGVRVHKLGGSGASTTHWGAVGAAWATQIAAMSPQLVSFLIGTNDQTGAMNASTFTTNLASFWSRLKTAIPYGCDFLQMTPPENQRTTNAVPMTAYAQAAREYAIPNDLAYIDLQYFFGSAANNAFAYAFANAARAWYGSDLIHPVQNLGGRAICDAVYRLLTLD